MINEAPKPDLKQKVAKTNKRGQTLKNFRLSQKDSEDAQDRAKRAQAQAPAGSTLKTKTDAPYSAQNYKATMAKRKADQKKAAASAAQKTKAVPEKSPTSVDTTKKNITTTKKKSEDDVIAKTVKGAAKLAGRGVVGGAKMVGKALKPTKKKAKIGAAGLAGAAAMAVPVVALHMGEQKERKTFDDIRKNG